MSVVSRKIVEKMGRGGNFVEIGLLDVSNLYRWAGVEVGMKEESVLFPHCVQSIP